jgi:hypothetical protein
MTIRWLLETGDVCHPRDVSASTWPLSRGPIEPLLGPGERILWQGQPDIWAYSMRGAWYLMPFSLLWGGFAIFWEVTALSSGAGPFFALWGIPFVVIGLYLIFGRIYVARREARRTHYAVTSRRVLIVSGAFSHRLTEIALTDLLVSQLDLGGSGLGTITFGTTVGAFRAPPGWPTMGMYVSAPAFASVRDAASVYRIVQDAKAAAPST